MSLKNKAEVLKPVPTTAWFSFLGVLLSAFALASSMVGWTVGQAAGYMAAGWTLIIAAVILKIVEVVR
jgi:putative Mn2+ efflux pump MntP